MRKDYEKDCDIRMKEVDEVLELLSDGKEHIIDEIRVNIGWRKAGFVLSFLSEYGFIFYPRPALVQLTPKTVEWFERVKEVESETDE